MLLSLNVNHVSVYLALLMELGPHKDREKTLTWEGIELLPSDLASQSVEQR